MYLMSKTAKVLVLLAGIVTALLLVVLVMPVTFSLWMSELGRVRHSIWTGWAPPSQERGESEGSIWPEDSLSPTRQPSSSPLPSSPDNGESSVSSGPWGGTVTYQTGPTITENITNITNVDNSTHTSVLNLNDLASDRLLFINADDDVEALNNGVSGQFLQSRGAGTTPTWVDITPGGVDWANPGSIGSGTANTGEFTGLTVAGSPTVLRLGTSSPLQVLDTGRIELRYVGDSGFLSSNGGALFIDNTNNLGTGIGIYSNAGAEAQGNMINVKVDNPLYDQAAFYMNYDGQSNAVEIVNNSNDSSSNALAVTGNNINDSTLGIIGWELAKGTVKITHNRPPGGTDSSASGLSIDLKGVGTRAQGVYVDSTEVGGTLGNLLRLRNETIDRFVVGPTGNLTLTGNISQGAAGTDTTFMKQGNNASDHFFVGVTGAFRVQRSAGNSEAFRTQIAGDTQGRWLGTSDGQLKWGPGNATQDITLRRGTAGTLFVDGALFINNLNQDLDTVVKGVNDSNLLRLDSSADMIGIGVSTPTEKLHISGGLRVTGAFRDANNAAGSSGFILTSTGTGTSWVNPSTLAVGNADTLDSLDSLQFLRSDVSDAYTSGTLTFDSGTALVVNGDLTIADTDVALSGASTNFTTTGNFSINTSAFFLEQATGRVGVGTTSPGYRLDVAGEARYTFGGGSMTWTLGNSIFGTGANLAANTTTHFGTTSGSVLFYANNSEAMRITSAGNVGIGTTNPTALLTVGTTAPFLVDASGNITQGLAGVNTTFTKNGNNAGDHFFIGTTGAFRVQRSASGSEAFRTQVSGDTQGRWIGTSDGQLRWGPGNAAQDVVLRRDSVGRLAVEGALVINNLNADVDTVIKGVSDSNLLYVDASANAVGIGTSNPLSRFQIGSTRPLHLDTELSSDPLFTNGPGIYTTSGSGTGIHSRFGALVLAGRDTVLSSQIAFITGDSATSARDVRMLIDTVGNVGIGTSAFGTNASRVLAIANSTAPTTSITDGIQLFAVDQAGSHELRVRDEAGNVTTLSPHNFSLLDEGPSEPLAWSHYSERNGLAINADMTKALRLVEKLSGEQIIRLENLSTGQVLGDTHSPALNLGAMSWISQLQRDYIAPTVATATQELLPRAEFRGLVEWTDQRWTTLAEAVFQARVTFEKGFTVLGNTIFRGPVTVNNDTGGTVVIPAGSAGVTVTFDKPYPQVPVVYVTPLSVVDVTYGVTNRSMNSFQIILSQPLAQDIEFSWLAVMVEQGGSQSVPLPAVTPPPSAPPESPTSEPSGSPTPSPAHFSDDEDQASPTPSMTPTPTPTSSEDASSSAQLGGED